MRWKTESLSSRLCLKVALLSCDILGRYPLCGLDKNNKNYVPIQRNLACSAGVFWVGRRKLLVYVRIVVAAIFDFMPEEDWGE